jgi:hypothetical protein
MYLHIQLSRYARQPALTAENPLPVLDKIISGLASPKST